MNLESKIHAFFNKNISDKQPENEYKPRAKGIVCVSRTELPLEAMSFNETMEHIHKSLRQTK